jgi:hypothetical protein
MYFVERAVKFKNKDGYTETFNRGQIESFENFDSTLISFGLSTNALTLANERDSKNKILLSQKSSQIQEEIGSQFTSTSKLVLVTKNYEDAKDSLESLLLRGQEITNEISNLMEEREQNKESVKSTQNLIGTLKNQRDGIHSILEESKTHQMSLLNNLVQLDSSKKLKEVGEVSSEVSFKDLAEKKILSAIEPKDVSSDLDLAKELEGESLMFMITDTLKIGLLTDHFITDFRLKTLNPILKDDLSFFLNKKRFKQIIDLFNLYLKRIFVIFLRLKFKKVTCVKLCSIEFVV